MIKVVSKKTHTPNSDDLYIGRGSCMGNPFHHKDSNHPQALYKVDTVEEAIEGFTEYLKIKLNEGDPAICNFINTIFTRELTGKDTNLVCFCDGLCHGNIIKNHVECMRYCVNWFSNMRRMDTPLIYEGIHYWTVENFYVAMKVPNSSVRQRERQKISQMTPHKSKTYGRGMKVRENWDDVKYQFMEIAISHKFREGTTWYDKLLSCKTPVIEWNNWGDKYWGRCIFSGEGENKLGELIENVRTIRI